MAKAKLVLKDGTTLIGESFGADVSSAGEVVFVGDSENDILCANALNIPSIVVSFGYSKIPVKDLNASIIMNNYKDLINHIQELNNI